MKSYKLVIPRAELEYVLSKASLPLETYNHEYILAFYKEGKTEFTVYDNTKNAPYKGIFKGKALPSFLKPYLKAENEKSTIVKNGYESQRTISAKVNTFPHIGSDEVGFGDFFGPLVVVAAYLDASLKDYVLSLNVKDSKKLSDTDILLLGNLLKDKVPHSKNIVNNDKYNTLIKEGYNMSHMKAMLHHNVLTKLARKVNYHGKLYLDAFTSERKYDEYTSTMKKAHVYFVKKGEANSLAIATASILARFYFLNEMAQLNKRFNTKIPLGAGKSVDLFAKEFLAKNGKSNLISVTKTNFRNFRDLFVTPQELL